MIVQMFNIVNLGLQLLLVLSSVLVILFAFYSTVVWFIGLWLSVNSLGL